MSQYLELKEVCILVALWLFDEGESCCFSSLKVALSV